MEQLLKETLELFIVTVTRQLIDDLLNFLTQVRLALVILVLQCVLIIGVLGDSIHQCQKRIFESRPRNEFHVKRVREVLERRELRHTRYLLR
jgi:hypothetical protein